VERLADGVGGSAHDELIAVGRRPDDARRAHPMPLAPPTFLDDHLPAHMIVLFQLRGSLACDSSITGPDPIELDMKS
jgi:hypothetical protein